VSFKQYQACKREKPSLMLSKTKLDVGKDQA
jgi:hypothetical protein